MKAEGKATKVVDAYHKYMLEKSSTHNAELEEAEMVDGRSGSGEARVVDIEFIGEEGKPRRVFITNEPMIVRMHYQADQPISNPLFGLGFHQVETEVHLAGPNNSLNHFTIEQIYGPGYVDYRIEHLPFLPGDYKISTAIYDHNEVHPYDVWLECGRFTIVPGGTQERYGLFALEGTWRHQTVEAPEASMNGLEDHGARDVGTNQPAVVRPPEQTA